MTAIERTASRGLLVRLTGGSLVLAAAVTAAWWFTRDTAAAPMPAGHNHTAMVAQDSIGSPVTLTAHDAQRIGVTYATAERGALVTDIRTVGLVAYDETRLKTIAPRVDGYVEELFVNFTGQGVRAGDPLLRLYSPMLVSAQEELLLAHRLAGAVGRDSTDASRQAGILIEAARRRLRLWDVPEDAIARIERTGKPEQTVTLPSPISGIVLKRNVLAGQRIMAGDATYEVADLTEVWLEGEIFERDLATVHVGQPVTATFDALPGDTHTGRIIFVAPTVSPETRTVQVRVALANPGLALKPGMYATIHIRGRAERPVINVPRSAVLVTGTRTIVFVRMADGMLAPRTVETGATTNDRVEIRHGLAAGETVVASATFLVDAESNLGSALAGMDGMAGMPDLPRTALPDTARRVPPPQTPQTPQTP